MVASGEAPRGVVPIENSIEGGVTFTQDTLLENRVRLCGEVMVDIEQCLLTNSPDESRVERVYSHPQGLAQCRRWLARHLPHAVHVPTASTAQAAHQVRDDPAAAAIASRLAAELAGVRVAHVAVQDRKPNVTRFLVLGNDETLSSGNDKTSLAFTTRHERGALVSALRLFDEQGLNLCRIESRPLEGETWQYVFFVDLEGHVADDAVARALRLLEKHSDRVLVFGSYPRATAAPNSA